MSQIKSRDRVREAGEVFTAPREVNAMLDLLPVEVFTDPGKTFLEPTCGDGAFVTAILERKLSHCADEVSVLRSVSAIYGIDIAADNVAETQERMLELVLTWTESHQGLFRIGMKANFDDSAESIIKANIQVGDSLNCDIHGTEWVWSQTTGGSWVCRSRPAFIWPAAVGATPGKRLLATPRLMADGAEQLGLFD